jgi:hypothetical protein
MSNNFFILPYDPALFADDNSANHPSIDLCIEPQGFSDLMFARWPDATVYARPNGEPETWTIPNAVGMRVHLQDSLQVVSFEGWLEEVMLDFVLWYRSVMPAAYDLWLLSEHQEVDSLYLTPDVTDADILAYMNIE